ncbi:hypothetical protein M432DRAFT_43420 [Thermoascus aurantiacus ATCC 26904]
MTSFLPVNNIPPSRDHAMDEATTPKPVQPSQTSIPAAQESSTTNVNKNENDPQSPRRSNEDSSRAGVSPKTTTTSASREGSSVQSTASAPDDKAIHDSDGDREGSENENENAGSAPPSKKKKGQRFFCTDFPPCNLSFTRSEHLARHIRKHTGERPFQCHCSRRFSRLDNLRQHAQTVHVNEEIPGDSLAATGTRFQRQIRTDRVRPQGRARAGTTGSQGTHSRGHSRNLSTSSIASTASTFSQTTQEIRRRPPPLIMANDGNARARLSLDTMGDPPSTPPGQIPGVSGQSPSASHYTPSNTFSAGGGSPHFGSPMSTSSHASGFWDGKTAARRLSVPTASNPFLPSHASTYPPPYVGSFGPSNSSFPRGTGIYASPTSSTYSSRDEPSLSAADAEVRRRTWHPSSFSGFPRPATSGLNQYQTPDPLQPSFGSNNGSTEQPVRLPGIESFDRVIPQQRAITPPIRKPSPMQIDNLNRQPPSFTPGFASQGPPAVRPPPPISGPGHRRGHLSWDISLHNNLTGLNLRDRTPQRDVPQWSQQSTGEIQSAASGHLPTYQQPSNQVTSAMAQHDRREHDEKGLGHEPATPLSKRHEWYNGPVSSNAPGSQVTRTSPEESSSSEGVATPSTSSLEYHPAIVHSNGYIEPHRPQLSADVPQSACAPLPPHPNGYHANHEPERRTDFFSSSDRGTGMGRLEALVAVATSENKGATRLFT